MKLYDILKDQDLYGRENNLLLMQKYLSSKQYLTKVDKSDMLKYIVSTYGFVVNWHPVNKVTISCLDLYNAIKKQYDLQCSIRGRFIAKFLLLHFNTTLSF